MSTSPPPPPPSFEDLPDTGRHNPIVITVSDHENRLRYQERRILQLVEQSRADAKSREADGRFQSRVYGLLVTVLLALAGGAVTFYTTGVKTADRVEAMRAQESRARTEVDELHTEVDALQVSVASISAQVGESERTSAQRHQAQQVQLKQISDRLGRRRR